MIYLYIYIIINAIIAYNVVDRSALSKQLELTLLFFLVLIIGLPMMIYQLIKQIKK